MVFEIKARDLLGRVGVLNTRRGKIKTPYMFPVISPTRQVISPRDMRERFKLPAIITNSYLIRKRYGEKAVEIGVHKLLDFDGIIMTDSGAYQILVYGDIDITPEDIIYYQEKINSDIAVILDYPSGAAKNKEQAEKAVEITLERAKQFFDMKNESTDILWVGPVQGSPYPDLVRFSAKEMSQFDFDIFAVGSQTILMEQYDFATLVDIFMNAKMYLPPDRPIHLFGAGHPIMFSLAVAMGADLFDSAAYALYAKDDRYITPDGTIRVSDLREQICACPVCLKYTPDEIKNLPKGERERVLAEHNLYVSVQEINRIRQAIYEGRLWEYIQIRLRAHPRLLNGLKRLKKYMRFIEKFDPVSKPKAMFYSGPEDAYRPEIIRYRKHIIDYVPLYKYKIALVMDERDANEKASKRFEEIAKKIKSDEKFREIHFLFLSSIFGIIPAEISHMYPLLQYEAPDFVDYEVNKNAVNIAVKYLVTHADAYKEIWICQLKKDPSRILRYILRKIKKIEAIKQKIKFFKSINEITEILQ